MSLTRDTLVTSNFSLRNDASQQLCNFESFSNHFDLPLKAAAEKFGVRATAFKKRCRAIGIRHWPYRKVRSLKRSIQELGRCKENGTITEKQRYQHGAFKRQLDRLLAPQTYGLDPTGRLVDVHGRDDDESSSDGDPACRSPEYMEEQYLDCSADKSPCSSVLPFNDTLSPVYRKTALPSLKGASMKNTGSPFGLTLRYPGSELGSLRSRVTVGLSSDDHCKEADANKADDFHEALEQMDYGNEKHFLDDLFVELSPIYDCKV